MGRGRLPLTALRSFEAAGRLLSFSRAAEELFVSQAAISRQVRELEQSVGRPLFERLHRRVELTEAGRMLLGQLTASFDDIERRMAEVIGSPSETLLRISVEPTFAAALLVPRLNAFRAQYPDIDVVIDASTGLAEFGTGEAEIAIRHSTVTTSWPRTQSHHLFDVTMSPVMIPALAASAPLHSPADLGRFTLLHETSRDAWARWFTAAGLPELAHQRGPLFPDGAVVMQAARLGHGVALGDMVLDAGDLRDGTLVRPFDLDVACGAYFLVAPDFERLSPAARWFAEWLLATLDLGTL